MQVWYARISHWKRAAGGGSVLVEAAVLFALLRLLRTSKGGKASMVLCMELVTVGLLYDGTVILLGEFLPEGLLLFLSQGRFLFHGLCMPLLLMIAVYALGVKKKIIKAVWGLVVMLMIFGAVAGLVTELKVVDFAGFVRCAAADGTPPWADSYLSILSVAMVVPLLLVGLWLMIKKKGPFLFLSGMFMFAFSALGPATGNVDLIFLIGMIGEALMVLCFLLHARKATKA